MSKLPRLKPWLFWTIMGCLLVALVVVCIIGETPQYRRYFWLRGERIIRYLPLPTSKDSRLEYTTVAFSPTEQRNLIVYLPPNYTELLKDRYPLIVFLHGTPGLETDWLNIGQVQAALDRAIKSGAIRPFIGAFPAGGSSFEDDTEYINSADGVYRNADFIYQNVVGYVDDHYPTIKNAHYRALAGVSSGGFGALNIGLRHQDVFNYILSFSGYSTVGTTNESRVYIKDDPNVYSTNSLEVFAPKLTVHKASVWLMVGDKDPYGLTDLNYGIERILKAAKFPVTLTVVNGGHGWEIWRPQFPNALAWLGKFWK